VLLQGWDWDRELGGAVAAAAAASGSVRVALAFWGALALEWGFFFEVGSEEGGEDM